MRRFALLLGGAMVFVLAYANAEITLNADTGCDRQCGIGGEVTRGKTWNPACDPDDDCYFVQCAKNGCSSGDGQYYQFQCGFYYPCVPEPEF
jgi:hypothetical protein